ncbi:MAG: hypothetical protein NC344_05925 [Bacteroidales bacterium]|nr:hypothetical protein [Bacteroidales bacterium]MCM1147358.1 hypothetical protein [Bacteroidales bacterium]MCM1206206.1 hypothetical protein [Bacillota bacterium]MCM1510440.1 hypothetical protein [Clostridium sp.]
MQLNLPKEFTDYTSRLFGEQRWLEFLGSFGQEAPASVRYNPFKSVAEVPGGERVPWCKDAYWLKERPKFTLDPLLHAGVYYVQEAGSMFLDKVLRRYVSTPVCMLDLCAAPGGKSTLARAALPEGSLLMTNEPDRHRANILMENMQKQGHRDVYVTNNYAKDFRTSKIMFDVILTDVPCSGEGMFRRDEGAIREWSLQNVRKCAEQQRSIVGEIWHCLRPGGLIIYSTCTFNLQENEENVRWIAEELGADILPVETSPEWGITGSLLTGFDAPVYRFIPGVTRSEGLFMCVMRKHGEAQPCRRPVEKQLKRLHILSDGKPQGEKKGKDIIPSHAEALLAPLSGREKEDGMDGYPVVELSLDAALRYLHREAIILPEGTPKGYVLVTYKGHQLGFVKNLGNRANNLYPKEWAIRNLNSLT